MGPNTPLGVNVLLVNNFNVTEKSVSVVLSVEKVFGNSFAKVTIF
jgi:hypothetical protein